MRTTTPKPRRTFGKHHSGGWGITARNIGLYSSAYHIAWRRISDLQKREQPNISLRLHASIRRQVKEGAKDPSLIASEALSDLQTSTGVSHKTGNGRRKPLILMERELLKQHLVLAEKHIAEGIAHVERQRQIVEGLERDGQDVGRSADLLALFEETLRTHIDERDRLVAELAERF